VPLGVAALTLALAATAEPAAAIRPVRSLYTTIDPAHCRLAAVDRSHAGQQCDGLPGYPLFISEHHDRMFVSVGPDADRRKAAAQSLASPNALFQGRSRRPAVEWRFVIRDGKPAPYATIIRYVTRAGPVRGEVLVVTRITERDACHIAYIDAVANAAPLVIARRIADDRTRMPNCGSDPVRIGTVGRSPM
jgi:hypothetical protein